MIGKGILVVLGSLVAGPAFAGNLDVCPTLTKGTWVISDVYFKGDPNEAVGLSTKEARAYIGKKLSVSDGEVRFAGDRCEVTKTSVEYVAGAWYFMRYQDKKLPYEVAYDCTGGTYIPPFYVGRSCDRIESFLLGFTFRLSRAR